MARLDQRHPDGVDGDWFADTRCIDCDVARHYAPERDRRRRPRPVGVPPPTRERRRGASGAGAPRSPVPRSRSARSRGAVRPTGCSRGAHRRRAPLRVQLRALLRRPLVPRGPTRGEPAGRLAEVHPSPVGTDRRARWHRPRAAHPSRTTWWMPIDGPTATARESGSTSSSTRPRRMRPTWCGDRAAADPPGLVVIPVPGHTRGSVAFHLEDRHLFTGDTLHWDHRRDHSTSSRSRPGTRGRRSPRRCRRWPTSRSGGCCRVTGSGTAWTPPTTAGRWSTWLLRCPGVGTAEPRPGPFASEPSHPRLIEAPRVPCSMGNLMGTRRLGGPGRLLGARPGPFPFWRDLGAFRSLRRPAARAQPWSTVPTHW